MRPCWYCGRNADTVDHVVPRQRGGTDWPDNLVPACRSCNAQKMNKTLEEYRHYVGKRRAGVPTYFSREQLAWLTSIGVDPDAHAVGVVFYGEKTAVRE